MQLAAKPKVCFYCGIGLEDRQGTFDHIQPFDRGGPNEDSNIVRCCLTCNREKFNKTPEELAQYRALQVACVVCGTVFRPRWAEWLYGKGRTCSPRCAGKKRWLEGA